MIAADFVLRYFFIRSFFDPSLSGKDSNSTCDAKECLSYCCVSGRNCRRQKFQDRQSAENSLRDDRSQSAKSQSLHPAPPVRYPGPYSDSNRQSTDELSDHAMTVLVNDAAGPGRQLVIRAIRSRPIGNGKSGVVAGNQSARDE